MARVTTNSINAAIAEFGVEVVKGDGYFYFADTGADFVSDCIPSVFSMTMNCMSVADWAAHVQRAIAEATP